MVAKNEKTRAYVDETKNERMDKKEIRARSPRSLLFFSFLSLSLAGRPHCMHNLKTTLFISSGVCTYGRSTVALYMFSCLPSNQTSVDIENKKKQQPNKNIIRIPEVGNKE